jgi:drug/metabolite transporter (DMT)-like permease
MRLNRWLIFAVVTTAFWGVWGALIELPEKAGFPATLGYTVWSLTMIPPALVAMQLTGWKLNRDGRSVLLGSVIGFLGAGGQLVLFEALRLGPAYIVFPVISLSPVVTVLLSVGILKEKASPRGWAGIALALTAIPLLSYLPPEGSGVSGYGWVLLSLLVFLAWGIQAYVMKFANRTMTAESIFFYMMVTAIILAPVAIWMTDLSQPINLGFRGPYLAALIQSLNSVGALTLVYAFRYGRAIIVSPMANAGAPVITILTSLGIYRVLPRPVAGTGMALAIAAAIVLAIEPEEPATTPREPQGPSGA